tara:strand:+ start:3184 stop:3768 length:585 start_codon:yes stop_codon:yes gene_type:complete
MAFQLADGTSLPLDVPFTIGTTNYPANWLRLSSADEKTAVGIKEVADPTPVDTRFYNSDGSAKEINDINLTYSMDAEDGSYKKGDLMKNLDGSQMVAYGLKTKFIEAEKKAAGIYLSRYDWQVIRKTEKGIDIDSDIVTYRDAIRTAYAARKSEIEACSDVKALETLYGTTVDSDGKFVKFNMTQYPADPAFPK